LIALAAVALMAARKKTGNHSVNGSGRRVHPWHDRSRFHGRPGDFRS
jgi:hypothetical protein